MAKIKEKKGGGEKKYKYRSDGTGFDIKKQVPDAAPGEYIASIKRVEMKPDKNKDPRMDITWQISEAVTEGDECEKSVKAFVTDRISFLPLSAGKRGNIHKQQLRKLCSHLDVDIGLVPTINEGANDEDFEELLEAIKEAGEDVTIWIAHRPSDDGQVWTDVRYVAPRGDAAKAKPKDEDEDEEEESDDDEDEDEKPKKKKKAVEKDEDEDEDDDDDDDEDEEEEEDEDEDEDEDDEDEKPKKKKKTKH